MSFARFVLVNQKRNTTMVTVTNPAMATSPLLDFIEKHLIKEGPEAAELWGTVKAHLISGQELVEYQWERLHSLAEPKDKGVDTSGTLNNGGTFASGGTIDHEGTIAHEGTLTPPPTVQE